MILGCIGDDFTGSSDVGLALSEGRGRGLRTLQYVGVPQRDARPDVEAGVVALKTRSVPVADAVAQSLAALDWLKRQGCRQFLFKYCSTFDSTPEGNIGPVAEALADALGHEGPVIVCPAFPATGRTVYQGHLFVQDRLLSESGMQHHPLTPMTDPDIRRWLSRQSRRPAGHVALATVRAGAGAVRDALAAEAAAGRPLVVCDAVEDADLLTLAEAGADLPLLTGGSGIAIGMPEFLQRESGTAMPWRGVKGPAVALSGSCSAATLGQVARHEASGAPVRRVAADDVIAGRETADAAAGWALERARETVVPLVTTSAAPEEVAATQERHGRERAAAAIEGYFAALALQLVEGGVTRLIAAGGETSGAVTTALAPEALEIGPRIAAGVPALRVEGRELVLALKSGNFGAPGFFAEAAAILEGA